MRQLRERQNRVPFRMETRILDLRSGHPELPTESGEPLHSKSPNLRLQHTKIFPCPSLLQKTIWSIPTPSTWTGTASFQFLWDKTWYTSHIQPFIAGQFYYNATVLQIIFVVFVGEQYRTPIRFVILQSPPYITENMVKALREDWRSDPCTFWKDLLRDYSISFTSSFYNLYFYNYILRTNLLCVNLSVFDNVKCLVWPHWLP